MLRTQEQQVWKEDDKFTVGHCRSPCCSQVPLNGELHTLLWRSTTQRRQLKPWNWVRTNRKLKKECGMKIEERYGQCPERLQYSQGRKKEEARKGEGEGTGIRRGPHKNQKNMIS